MRGADWVFLKRVLELGVCDGQQHLACDRRDDSMDDVWRQDDEFALIERVGNAVGFNGELAGDHLDDDLAGSLVGFEGRAWGEGEDREGEGLVLIQGDLPVAMVRCGGFPGELVEGESEVVLVGRALKAIFGVWPGAGVIGRRGHGWLLRCGVWFA